ncbi:hydantoinase/oxoprolinase family protein [Roseomonas marmotae]|uniref:Hydantoinase/oxoprolinase family protein n=1 Tax=Roseomonas marmotae TaxID=2768161 RepID=A0ABS3KJJ8_9PROT|nr:hydantoinase/oxoprolinase family protein [Roseomonas marmotae]MBO1077177.1 hydantoinase/oxoprolinase family protein [Roseomonas marmotae]QTI82044.1 hydantoinase/oxoprolinase family protein [Roseomonas marmotae]
MSIDKTKTFRLGVDIGGTFTDIVLLSESGQIYTKKLLSSPPDYSESIENGVRELLRDVGVAPSQVTEFIHGTTVVTNTIIERKGEPIALVTTRGFRDVLELGRFRAPSLYDSSFRKLEPLAERRLRFEVTERVAADGSVLQPLVEDEIAGIAEQIEKEGITSVAICFINAYANGVNEKIAARLLRERLPDLSISTSSQLLPKIQEYERTSTTAMNAYVRPVAERYIDSLQRRLTDIGITCDLMIMQSAGGVVPGKVAAQNPVYIVESGPAAGVVGAQRLSGTLGVSNIMVVDVGGTTAKASLIEDGAFTVATESEVGGSAAMGHRLIQGAGYPVQAPTIDIAEVGAGGGSIAAVDQANGLRVGPRSAGAVPGPACYGRGGEAATVTDANLILGYISPSALVGGELSLDRRKAEQAVGSIAGRLDMEQVDAAYGVHLIANSNMMRALNGVSSERGRDPSQYALFAIGGNGSVHGTKLADDLRMNMVIVPPASGVFSALGLLFADVEHQVIRTFYRHLHEVDPAAMTKMLMEMEREARGQLADGGFDENHMDIRIIAEARYFGQQTTLPLTLESARVTREVLEGCSTQFTQAHELNYGYNSPHEKIQFVSLKVLGRGLCDQPRVPEQLTVQRGSKASETRRQVYFGPEHGWIDTPVISRGSLTLEPRQGPVIVEEYESTSVVRPGWSVEVDPFSNIVMRRIGA